MNKLTIYVTICTMFLFTSNAISQFSNLFGSLTTDNNHVEFTALHFDGKPMTLTQSATGYYAIAPNVTGSLTVSTMNTSCNKKGITTSVGFKIGIKDKHSNTIWMYSDKTFYEIQWQELIAKCKMGDSLIFMVVDRQYRLLRHEVVLMDGC